MNSGFSDVQGWIDHGDKAKDPFMRFMFYWIAFNMLYSNHMGGYGSDKSELEAILEFYREYEHWFSDFDAFSQEEMGILTTAPIRDGRQPHKQREKCIQDGMLKGEYESLFKALYQIRCNFVHGNKTVDSGRDEKLVEAAATILRGMLGTLPQVN